MGFLAVVITGLSLIAPAAHAFELLNKIGLPQAEYFIVQQIYSGWWMLGLFLPLAFLANVGNAIVLRADRTAMMLSIAAAVLIALNLIVFMLSPSRQTPRPRIGPCSLTIGKPFARNGNTRTPSTPG